MATYYPDIFDTIINAPLLKLSNFVIPVAPKSAGTTTSGILRLEALGDS